MPGHREGSGGAESAALAAVAYPARATAPAAAECTAAAVDVPAAVVLAAVVPSKPSQSSRSRQLKPTERKTNEDVPGTGISPTLIDP